MKKNRTSFENLRKKRKRVAILTKNAHNQMINLIVEQSCRLSPEKNKKRNVSQN